MSISPLPVTYDSPALNYANESPLPYTPPYVGGLHERLPFHVNLLPTRHFSIDSPSTASISGSSAQLSDDEYIRETDFPTERAQSHTQTPPPRSILDAPRVYSIGTQVDYGEKRLLFVERLIWNCAAQVYGVWGLPTRREPGATANGPLQQLVRDGLVHGLCNEIVILPVMENIQNSQTGCHSTDLIPFPLFMAEMLRRMRASCFLLSIAIRYMLDITNQVQLARARADCGWCRSGIEGCPHRPSRVSTPTSRFSKGRSLAAKAPEQVNPPNAIPNSTFTKADALSPLTDPRKAFLGCLILANKFHRDRSSGNKSWASLIGLPLEEVHNAERAVAEALEWSLSRPWLSEQSRSTGADAPGPIHPSFSEPLFATNEAEVNRYGVKALRDTGRLPAPQTRTEIFPDTHLFAEAIIKVDIEAVLTGASPTPSRPSPPTAPTSRRGSINSDAGRRLAPLPAKVIKANPLRKASTAPGILELNSVEKPLAFMALPQATISPPSTQSTNNPHTQYNQPIPFPPHLTGPSAVFSPNGSTWSLSFQQGKRKASQELGPQPVARCGEQGQRIPIRSPSDSDLATPQPSIASISPTDSKHPRTAITRLDPSLWDLSADGEDIDMPELDSEIECDKTPAAPGVVRLCRTATPPDLMDLDYQVAIRSSSGQDVWEMSRHAKTDIPVGHPAQSNFGVKATISGSLSLLSISS